MGIFCWNSQSHLQMAIQMILEQSWIFKRGNSFRNKKSLQNLEKLVNRRLIIFERKAFKLSVTKLPKWKNHFRYFKKHWQNENSFFRQNHCLIEQISSYLSNITYTKTEEGILVDNIVVATIDKKSTVYVSDVFNCCAFRAGLCNRGLLLPFISLLQSYQW